MLSNLFCLANRIERKIHAPCEFLGSWFAPEFLYELPARTSLFVDRLDHVHGNADGERLIGDRASDTLANLPGRVSGELVSAAPLEFIDCLHQADVAFLDQIQKLQAAVGVFLGD